MSEKLSYEKAADVLIALIQSSGYRSHTRDLLEEWSRVRTSRPTGGTQLAGMVTKALPDAMAVDALLFRSFLDTLVDGSDENLQDRRERIDNVLTQLRSR